MATPNYTPAYRNYLYNSAGYVIPSTVRTYSVFDPASNTYKRMTNNGMSPMPMTPEQEQANIQAALRYAESARGRVYDEQTAQPLMPTQTPGIMLRPRTPAQTPAQMPLGGSRMAPNGQQRGGMGIPASPASRTSQRASQGQIQVPAYDERIARERAAFGDPMAGDEFLHEAPIGVPGYQGKRPYVTTSTDIENAKQMFQPNLDLGYQFKEPIKRPLNAKHIIEEEYEKIPETLHMIYGPSLRGPAGLQGLRALLNKDIFTRGLPKGSGAQPMGDGTKAPGSGHRTWKARPDARRTYSQATREAQRPVDVEWVEVTPTGPAAINGLSKVQALPAPSANTATGFKVIKTQANIPSGMPIRLGGYPELPPAGVGVQPMGRTAASITSAEDMTNATGLANWAARNNMLINANRPFTARILGR